MKLSVALLLVVSFAKCLVGEETPCDFKSYVVTQNAKPLGPDQEGRFASLYSESDVAHFARAWLSLVFPPTMTKEERAIPNLLQGGIERATTAIRARAQDSLNSLGYGVRVTGLIDVNMTESVRRFQRLAGLKPTGVLTMQTDCLLTAAAQAKKEPQFILPSKAFYWKEGYVNATGTFRMVNGKAANTMQTSEINCTPARCVDTTVLVNNRDGYISPSINIDEYEIEQWGDSEVVTKPRKTGPGCVQYVLRLNRIQESVSMLRSTIDDKGICEQVDKEEYYLILEDGFKLSLERNNATLEKWRKYAPDLVAIGEKLRSAITPQPGDRKGTQ